MSTNSRAYDSILIDLDGTLLNERGEVPVRTREALRAAEARGVRTMIATGRSTVSTRPVLEVLGLETPAIVFNGAGLWCPVKQRMLEERVFSNSTFQRALSFGRTRDLLTVVMCADKKFGTPPRDAGEARAISGLTGLAITEWDQLTAEFVMRVTYFSRTHDSSLALAEEAEREIDRPLYITHFPLNWLSTHRDSPFAVLDLHPPCRGKAEGVRVLEELYGIPAERVVAVGDATNDIPMFEAAGLAVAMASGVPEARAAADRIIGDNESTALAELVEELFLG